MPARRRAQTLTLAGLLAGLLLAACAPARPSATAPAGGPSQTPDASTPGPVSGSVVASPSEAPSPVDSQAGSTNPPLPSGPDRLRIEPVASGLTDPIGIVAAGDGTGRLFVNERSGRVRVITADGGLLDAPFVDLSSRISGGGERGLLGLAFHPGFAANRRLFVHYSRAADGASVVSELIANAVGTAADPATERVLLTVRQPFSNHNGGQLAFGPDGYLYIGLGDGGSGGDPFGNAQDRNALLGKLLRIDVDRRAGGAQYAIPDGNPFAAGGLLPGGGAPEVWALGLRNPWRFSFDPEGRDLYIADVGQSRWEEINRQPGDSRGGENYGWNVMEGRHCYATDCEQGGYVKPIAEYSHDAGCSVTGGHVYRGTRYPELVGVYVFGDYCSGTIFTLQVDEGTITPKPVLDSGLRISAFGTDEAGEIYVADLAGGIYQVRPG